MRRVRRIRAHTVVLVLGAWQVQTQPSVDEAVCRVWGGRVRRCLLETEIEELAIDVVEVRVVPQHFDGGRRLPAHGSVTFDVRSEHVWRALTELARSREVAVLRRPDGGAVEMRFCEPAQTRSETPADGALTTSNMTFRWRAP
jgi:hypothetical protein